MEDLNIKDIARIAGVSISTVSRVLNDHPDVSGKTKVRVQDIIKKYSYIPNNSARNLKLETIKAVGVIIKGISNPFFTDIIKVIQRQLDRDDYTMILHPVDSSQDEVEEAIVLSKEKKPAGLIFLGGSFEHKPERLDLLDIPFVMATITMKADINRSVFSSVTIDDYSEGYRIGEYVCKGGHKHIAAIGYAKSDKGISRLRLDGLRQALSAGGLTLDDSCVEHTEEYTYSAGYEKTRALLERHSFTCLFCISDTLAIGAMRAIHDFGLDVPGDVSVIGFDGLEAARFCTPALTTIKQPGGDIARESVDILMNIIKRNRPHKHKVFSGTLIQGESFRSLI